MNLYLIHDGQDEENGLNIHTLMMRVGVKEILDMEEAGITDVLVSTIMASLMALGVLGYMKFIFKLCKIELLLLRMTLKTRKNISGNIQTGRSDRHCFRVAPSPK